MSARQREAGFVLLLVLWTTALLGLLSTQLVARARGEASVALSARDEATLEAAADGGVNAAIFGILNRSWRPDGVPHQESLGPIRLTTTVMNEAGRINPNATPPVLMRSFLHVLGVDLQTADDLTTAMLRWRTRAEAALPAYRDAGRPFGPTGQAFQTIDEIGLVLGMTPALLSRMRPHLSLFKEGDVDLGFADAVVRQAFDEAAGGASPFQALHVNVDDLLVRVDVEAIASAGRRFVREAEVRFAARPDSGAADYVVLSWNND